MAIGNSCWQSELGGYCIQGREVWDSLTEWHLLKISVSSRTCCDQGYDQGHQPGYKCGWSYISMKSWLIQIEQIIRACLAHWWRHSLSKLQFWGFPFFPLWCSDILSVQIKPVIAVSKLNYFSWLDNNNSSHTSTTLWEIWICSSYGPLNNRYFSSKISIQLIF